MSSTNAPDTRIAILDAARSLYEVEGYFTVGLEAVARKAGVSRQAIYLHFESKADLLRALHDRVHAQDVEPAMRRVWKCKTATEALDVWVAASAHAVPKIIGIANTLDAARRVDPEVEATWQRPKEGRYGDCRRLAEWLQHEGALATGLRVGEAADILWSLTSIHGYESLVVDRAWSSTRWIRWVRQTLQQQLLGGRPGRAG